jgi:hypothetical protein
VGVRLQERHARRAERRAGRARHRLPARKVLRGSTVGLHAGADGTIATAEAMPPPWRYDDHYGFGTHSGIE